ncbi:MFS transporter [Streptomyces sp. NPDC127084]|uniref:MFS transporter n=1 Tax=Streptomyces sp. NPDC127084 TaxID=3347133 RepID=UPI0036560B04
MTTKSSDSRTTGPHITGTRLLTALAGSQLLVALDFSIIYVALPDVGRSLQFSSAALQWIVSAYAIFFSGFLLLGGQVVDALGANRVFLAAQSLFALASVGAALSGSASTLIAARVGQGVAAAMLVPATLALISSAYPAGPARNRALSIWGSTGAVGLALGVVVGGVLLTVASWPWIFWINLPIVAGCLIAAGGALFKPATHDRRHVDISGALLASITVVAVVLTFTEVARPHTSWLAVAGSAVMALAAGLLFLLDQRRGRHPLIPAMLYRVRTLQVACLASALYWASFGAEFFVFTLYLQDERGYSALAAGLAFLPLAATIGAGNIITGLLAGHWGLRKLLTVAYSVGAAGLGVLAAASAVSSAYVTVILPGLVLSGLGQGMAFAGTYITGTRDLPAESSGMGSAVINTTQYTGGAIGLAILVVLLGQNPGPASFALAFSVTAVLALAVVPVIWRFLSPADNAAA